MRSHLDVDFLSTSFTSFAQYIYLYHVAIPPQSPPRHLTTDTSLLVPAAPMSIQ